MIYVCVYSKCISLEIVYIFYDPSSSRKVDVLSKNIKKIFINVNDMNIIFLYINLNF